ncbi:MAG: lysozyme [Pseudomonadales bacterium]|nr:lysozyme [Pseudomonadales bacterium]
MAKRNPPLEYMQTSEYAVEMIKELDEYQCSIYFDAQGLAVIGHAHRITENEHDYIGKKITRQEAHDLLLKDLRPIENALNRFIQVEATQDQFDALVSLSHSIGVTTVVRSNLLMYLNNGEDARAAEEFYRWIYLGKKMIPKLRERRELERGLFMGD